MVSIKNLPGGNDRIIIFVVISVILHILLFYTVNTVGTSPLNIFFAKKKKPKEPLVVEVVELPEKPMGELKRPEKTTRYAQRSESVKEEQVPEEVLSPGPMMSAPSVPEAQEGKIKALATREVKAKEERPELEEPKKKEALSEDKKSEAEKKEKEKEAGKEVMISENTIAEEIEKTGSKEESKDKGKEETLDGKSETPTSQSAVRLVPTERKLKGIARSHRSAARKTENRGKSLLLNTAEFKYQKYFMALRRRIEFYWEYPVAAGRAGQHGRLKIDFTIEKDGTVKAENIRVIKSSNYPILDDAAVTAIRLAAPFNPLPEHFGTDEITVHGQFEYSLYNAPPVY